MPKRFSIRPALTFKGRTFKGLRGWAGKPLHPPLTDIPVAAYLFAAVFDVLSWFWRDDAQVRALFLHKAALYVLVGGYAVGVLAVLTGWADWHRSSKVGTQARRTINTHGGMMILTQIFALGSIVLHLTQDFEHSTAKQALLSVLAAAFVSVGSTYGGSLVFDYGFNVETSGDHPVWHESETDVFPDHHDEAPSTDSTTPPA